jgi:hypothetical protein
MNLKGSKREIRKFIKDITISKDAYDINQLVPLDPRASKEIKAVDSDGNETSFTAFTSSSDDGFDGYLDAVSTWGSKWGACNVEIDDPLSPDTVIRYESAWSPCSQLIQTVSTKYPNVVFSILSTEESRAFAIYEIIHNGETVAEQGIDPSNYSPEVLEVLTNAETEETEEAWDKWYEAESDWNNSIEDILFTDCQSVARQYVKHLAQSKRREKQGKEPLIFSPS